MRRTLFHWDTPLALQLEYGGFASEHVIDDFVNYAVRHATVLCAGGADVGQEIVFRAYNGSMNTWVTFNEPVVFYGQVSPMRRLAFECR